ncbi:MAG: hypothetical protein OXC18_07635 [Desulfurellaceae bacterium]|nr:hypothetical protein [Desulfurellaceae bacterium]
MMSPHRDRGGRHFRFPLTPCLVFLLAGCSAIPRFPDSLQSWPGRTETELLAAYDTAPSVYTLNERTDILTWSAFSFKPVDPLSAANKLNSHSETLTSTSHSKRCAVSFTVVDGVVQKWDWRGDNRRLCPVPRPPASR